MVKAEPISTPRLPLQPIDPNVRRMVAHSHSYGYGTPLPFFNKHNHVEYTAFVSRYDSPALDAHAEATRFIDASAQLASLDPIAVDSTSPVKTPLSESTFDDLPEGVNDTAKLKGVLWPGMSLFDSATPTARRKRNQKKDASILEQLECNSMDVEPTEMVWFADGILKKQKRISGMVDSSSSPPKSSPVKRQRVTLADVDLYQPYFGEAPLGGRSNLWMDEGAETSQLYSPFERRGASGGIKRKRGFEVWQDEDAADREVEQNSAFMRPSGFKYLTEGFNMQAANHRRGDNENPSPLRLLEDPFSRQSTTVQGGRPNFIIEHQPSYPFASTSSNQRANHTLVGDNASTISQDTSAHTGLSARASLGSSAFRQASWPQSQQLQYASVAHSQQSSLTLTHHQQDHAVAPMYAAQADWFPALGGTDNVANHTSGQGHSHGASADYHALFAANGFSGYHTGMDGNYFDRGANSTSGFFAINNHHRTDSIPGISQLISSNAMQYSHASGIQQLTEAVEMSAPPDAKLNTDNSGTEQVDETTTYDAKSSFEREMTRPSEETEDEDRTISEPCSQT